MKKILLILLSLGAIIFVGCNDGDDNLNANGKIVRVAVSDITMSDANSMLIDSSGNIEAFTHPQKRIIASNELLDAVIADLNESVNHMSDSATEDREQVLSWIRILNEADVDFAKENLFVYTILEEQICNYQETISLNDSKYADIKFEATSTTCDSARILYYLVYKVSKKVETIGIKAFDHGYVTVENIL